MASRNVAAPADEAEARRLGQARVAARALGDMVGNPARRRLQAKRRFETAVGRHGVSALGDQYHRDGRRRRIAVAVVPSKCRVLRRSAGPGKQSEASLYDAARCARLLRPMVARA